jgi:hypothetical protein
MTFLGPADTVQAEGPKYSGTASLHNLMPSEGLMDIEAIPAHDLLPAEAAGVDEAIPLQQDLMPAATSPEMQLQLMMPAQASANSDATHFTGGQVGLPLFMCQPCLTAHNCALTWLVSQQASCAPPQSW